MICPWAVQSDIERHYHDHEWGVPLRDERALFEFLCLEGAQAGLSWRTILVKRDHYREVFDNFEVERVARYDTAKVARLLADPGIVRNRLKVESVISNARVCLALNDAGTSLGQWLWAQVGDQPLQPEYHQLEDVPSRTALSERVSRELRSKGFRFVGPTIMFSYLTAAGLINGHLMSCPAR